MNSKYQLGLLDIFLCFGCLMTALWILAMLEYNPIRQHDGVEKKAEFLIIATWETDSLDDVDCHLQDPNGKHCWFQMREAGLLHLDRDDRGKVGDTSMNSSGEAVVFAENTETMSIRAIISGEYTYNLHMYSKRDKGVPTEVSIKVLKLNPKVKTVRSEKIILTEGGQEETVFRFDMDSEGNLTNWHKLKKSLANQHGYDANDYGKEE